MISYFKKCCLNISKILTTQKKQRKLDIISFLNKCDYFKEEFPYPCQNENSIINDNHNLFELVFIPREEEVLIYNIFKNKISSNYGKRRNCILCYYEGFSNFGEKKLKKDTLFNGITLNNLIEANFNIYKFVFQKEMMFFISLNFSTHTNNTKQTSWDFAVKENDLSSFFEFCEKQILTYTKPEFKIKNTLELF